jgi:hypothetical protein
MDLLQTMAYDNLTNMAASEPWGLFG